MAHEEMAGGGIDGTVAPAPALVPLQEQEQEQEQQVVVADVEADGDAAGGQQGKLYNTRDHWRPSEDARLKELVAQYGPRHWNAIAENLEGRSGKSCRLRWVNQLDPQLKRSAFSEEEEQRLLAAQRAYGNKWSLISTFFPGRTDNAIKNRWHAVMARNHREQFGSSLPRRNKHSASASSSAAPAPPQHLAPPPAVVLPNHNNGSPPPMGTSFNVGAQKAAAASLTHSADGDDSDDDESDSICTTDLFLGPAAYQRFYNMIPHSAVAPAPAPSAFSAPPAAAASSNAGGGDDKPAPPFYDFLGVGEP